MGRDQIVISFTYFLMLKNIVLTFCVCYIKIFRKDCCNND